MIEIVLRLLLFGEKMFGPYKSYKIRYLCYLLAICG